MLRRRALIALPALLAARAAPAQSGGWTFAGGIGTRPGGPLLETLTDAAGAFPRADRGNWFRQSHAVDGYSRTGEILPSRRVARPPSAMPFRHASTEPSITYDGIAAFGGGRHSLDGFMDRNPTTGLVVVRDDTILLERYQYARTPAHRFISFSMAKTLTALLIGMAQAQGAIGSLDAPAEAHSPALAGSEYGRTPLRHLLTMSSGVRFREEYDGNDDIARLARAAFAGPGGAAAATQFNDRIAPPGERFYYASAETFVLALVLRGALGRPIADFTTEMLWTGIGAESDATWLIDRAGNEVGYTGFNATLRDFARLGLLLARGGTAGGRQIVPERWVAEMTREHVAPSRMPGRASFGYGYQTWTLPGGSGFALLGVRGQAIYVDPRSRLVMAHTAVRPNSRDPGAAETYALWRGLRRSLG